MMPAREKGEFYKKDRKVLRFFCKYKDSRLQGDKRDYILYYYLLNDTVEIKEARLSYRLRPCYLIPRGMQYSVHDPTQQNKKNET